ncbi:hypothetical protein E2C01_095200 [Portunus trituberculatus]|uniref:Uncharacterized protein n=1 Tax=Portunus trituberculatus TaxID=210409 RepID=A0A5B7K549_PORTR|nr:hypothetical protein [Portunus trituberculatus]
MKHAISCNVVVVVLLLVATATGRNIEEVRKKGLRLFIGDLG